MTDQEFKERIYNKFNGNLECLDTFISYRKTPKLRFKCNNPLHNEEFTVTSQQILRTKGKGCPFCNNQSKTQLMIEAEIKEHFKNQIEFIDKWEYGINNTYEEFKFKCYKHGEFTETLHNMLNNYTIGCKQCSLEMQSKNKRNKTLNKLLDVIKESNLIVLEDTVKGVNDKATFICKEHNETFERTVGKVIYNGRFKCPKCVMSNGEYFTLNILNELGYTEVNKTLELQKPVGSTKMRFDFYLPQINTAIEFDGKQHYSQNSYFYDEDQIERDKLKNNFCLENNISIIRIKSSNVDQLQKIKDKVIKDIKSNIKEIEGSTTSSLINIEYN